MSIYKKSNLLSFHTLILFIIIMIISDSAHARVAIFTAPIPFENSTKGAQVYLDLEQLKKNIPKRFKKEIKKAEEHQELLTEEIIKDLFINKATKKTLKKAIKIKIVDLQPNTFIEFIENEKPVIKEPKPPIDPIVEQTKKNRIEFLQPSILKEQKNKLIKITPDLRPKPEDIPSNSVHNVWPQLIEDTIQNFKKAPQIIKPDYEQFPDESEIGLNYFGIAPLSLKEVDAEDHKEQIEDEHNNEGLTEDENPFALYPEQDLLDQEDEESKSEQPIMLAESLIIDEKQPIETTPSLKPVQNSNWINGIRTSSRSRLFINKKNTPKPPLNELNQQEFHPIQTPQKPSSMAPLSPLTQTPALLPDIHKSGNKIVNNSKSLHSPSINTPNETSTPPFISKKSKKKISPIISDQASPSILQSNRDIKRILEKDTPRPVHGNQYIETTKETSTPPFIPKKPKKKISRIIPEQASPSILQSNRDIKRILEKDTPRPVHENQNIENTPVDFNIPFVTSPKKGTPLKPSSPYDDPLSPKKQSIYNEQAQFTPQPQSVQVFHVRPLVRRLKEISSNPLKPEKKSRAQKERRKALPYDQSLQFFADLIDENSINPITQPHQKDEHIGLPNDLAMPKPQKPDDTITDNNKRTNLKPLNITQEAITPPSKPKHPKRRIKPIVLDPTSPITHKENQTITPSPKEIYYPSWSKGLFQDQEEEDEIENEEDDLDDIVLPNDLAMPKLQEKDDTITDNNKQPTLPIIKPLNITQETITPPFNPKQPKRRIKPIALDQISPITHKEDPTITPSPRVIYYPSRPKALFQDAEEEEEEIEYEEDDLDDADPIDNDPESYKKVNILDKDAPKFAPSFIPPPPPAPSLQDLNKPRLMPQKDLAEQEDRTIKKQVAKPTPKALDNHLHSSLALRRARVIDSPESSPETKAPKFEKPIGKEIKPIEFNPEPKKSAALQKIFKDLEKNALEIIAICVEFKTAIKSNENNEELLVKEVIRFKDQPISGYSAKTKAVSAVRTLYKKYEALKKKQNELKESEQKQIQKEAAEAEKRAAIEAEKAAAKAKKEAEKRRKAAQPDILDRAKIAAVKFTDLIKGFVFKKKDEIVREDIEMDDFIPSQSVPNIPIAKDPNPPAGGSSETIMDSLAQKINMFKNAQENKEKSDSDSDDDWDD
ncbi:MAG: hypothetical protein Q8S31_09200 [Alphaproteobacteria bacterium]|nr:hypothetical protein [Alphaproteobacteria bacterium]